MPSVQMNPQAMHLRGLWRATSAVAGLVALAAGAVGLMPAWGQQSPESLLPPGFDHPAQRPARPPRPAPHAAPRGEEAAPAPAPAENHPLILARPAIGADTPAAGERGAGFADMPGGGLVPRATPKAGLPPMTITSFAQLMALPPAKIDELLGLRPKDDIPAAARRALSQVGLVDSNEGGLPPFTLEHQDAMLVRAALAGNGGRLVSRWGHILLRRALASRLDAPPGMDGAEFAALRAALLVRMGEGDAARALVQDIDPDNYTPGLTQSAMDAYVATEDFTGICPLIGLNPDARKDSPWLVAKAMCQAFTGAPAAAMQQLDRLTYNGAMPHIDMLLAQKYAGAAGVAGRGGHRAVTIEWDSVSDMTPWRLGLTLATGLTPPASLMQGADPRYDDTAALAPMLGLGARADAADRAGGDGVLSAAAMVDLYSQIYADDAVSGGPADRALLLRDAYVGDTPDARLKAMQQLWDGATEPLQHYARAVLTAYAAARLPVASGMAGAAGDIIAAMLAAGLDANALRWASTVESGSQGWALLQLAAPQAGQVGESVLEHYQGGDPSAQSRKSAFLIAGLAGLGRVSDATRRDFAGRVGAGLEGSTHWTQLIDQAAAAGNPTLVALLAGLGMQGDSWAKMTPRYLYHIVGALNRVGLGAEARMIAAEAVARG